MNLNLGDEWEVYVRRKVDSGFYQSGSEVIREGLRLLREKDLLFEQRLKQLGADIESIERGEGIDSERVIKKTQREKPYLSTIILASLNF